MFCTIEQYGKVLVVVLVGAGQTTLVVALAVAVVELSERLDTEACSITL